MCVRQMTNYMVKRLKEIQIKRNYKSLDLEDFYDFLRIFLCFFMIFIFFLWVLLDNLHSNDYKTP